MEEIKFHIDENKTQKTYIKKQFFFIVGVKLEHIEVGLIRMKWIIVAIIVFLLF